MEGFLLYLLVLFFGVLPGILLIAQWPISGLRASI
jgi:hypothetical protein